MARSAENDWVVAMNDVSVGASRSKINAGYAARQLQRRTSFGKFRQSLRLRRSRKSMAEKSCKELALEGERLCKEGFVDEGIEKLESAIRVGTTDKKTLSALYSQLGNAYFYQEKYSKCLECHNSDLRLTRDMGDKLGEAKACGNIGNALKAMGQYDESIACCRMQLDLAREVSNKVLESRALYNLGNVFHAHGKFVATCGFPSNHDKASIEEYSRTLLEQAARHYEANLKLVKEMGDYQAQGRTIGNLGNTHYLLGNYKKSIRYHEERLQLAEQLGDKMACRRALSNLGNAHVYLGKYGAASQHYLRALEVSLAMGDSAYEAQSCYSLGDVYTLWKNYPKAIEYYSKHLHYAIELGDRVGEARAYWSIASVHTTMVDLRQARHFTTSYMQLAVELGDSEGVDTARKNLAELDNMLQLQDKYECPSPQLLSAPARHSGSFSWASVPMWRKKMHKKSPGDRSETSSTSSPKPGPSPRNSRAGSTSPTGSVSSSHDGSFISGAKKHYQCSPLLRSSVEESGMDENFLELLSKAQSQRLDDQRSDFHPLPSSSRQYIPSDASSRSSQISSEEDDLFDSLWKLQGCRIEEQRCEMPASSKAESSTTSQSRWRDSEGMSSDELFDLIFASQSSRINDQRSPDPKTISVATKTTMPNEDFFNLIQHLQSTRIEDQRSPLPVLAN